jgi:hypothetical protein
LFNSVQKSTCDLLGNATIISINQALESIHLFDKFRFDHFDLETCQKHIHYFIRFIFLIIFSPFKLGFQPTEKKKSDGAISGRYDACGVRLNQETSNFSRVALAA